MVLQSRYLGLLALLIIVVQISINLVDYEYNRFLAHSYPATDARTQIIGRIYAAIDFGSISLQVLTGVILKYAGVGGTLVAIPVVLAAAVSAFVAIPRFLSIAVGKVLSKALDYSLFRAAKEILYIPLDYDAKTRGKAVVDMLVYRFAKGLASAVILAVTAWWGKDAGLGVLTLGFILAWLLITVAIVRRYRAVGLNQASSPNHHGA